MKIYYGEETKKAIKNFVITEKPVNLRSIYALTKVKWATALANFETKRLDKVRRDAIVTACKEILSGTYDDQFVTDAIQGGAGTSINMNVNEVIANRATEILKGKTQVHSLDHVNLGQSTNDSVPAAVRLTILEFIDEYAKVQDALADSFAKKGKQFADVIKVGRTHLQDAVPVTLGQEFTAYASFVRRDKARMGECKKYFYPTNLGGTAIGTGINASKSFIVSVNKHLAKLTGYPFVPAKDLIDATQNADPYFHIAELLIVSAVGISKICNDLRAMASGPRAGLGEIKIPELQKGSSIMPGKVNPVVFETLNQIAFQVVGNASASSLVVHSGQFELNVMMPTFIKNNFESFHILINGLKMLKEKAIDGLEANKERCRELFENSLCMATALNRYLGYDKTAKIVKDAMQNKTTLRQEILNQKLFSAKELDKIFSIKNLTEPLA